MEQWTEEPTDSEVRVEESFLRLSEKITRAERKERRENLIDLFKDTDRVKDITRHIIDGNYGYLFGRRVRNMIIENRSDDRIKYRTEIRKTIGFLECQLHYKDYPYAWHKLTNEQKTKVNIAIDEAVSNCE